MSKCKQERIAKKLTPNSRRVLVAMSDGGRIVTVELVGARLAWLGFQCAHITRLGDEVARWLTDDGGDLLPNEARPEAAGNPIASSNRDGE